MMHTSEKQRGQIGLIVLLIAAVILTVGISVATRSVSEVSLTQQEEASTEALNVAEAGIEELLARDLPDLVGFTQGTIGGAEYEIEATDEIRGVTVFEGHSIEFDLTGASSSDGLNISWDTTTSTSRPAFVVTVISGDGLQMKRYVNDAYSRLPDATSMNPYVLEDIGITSAGIARIKVLYEQADGLVVSPKVDSGTWDPPVQYHILRSQAINTAGSARSVQVNKSRAQLPSIFDYVLFSGTSLQ